MARPLDSAQLNHAIELYLAGKSPKEITAASGVSHSALFRERTRRGIPPLRIHLLPVDELAGAYRSGESEYSLAHRYGVLRSAVRRHLESAGVEIRSRSAAGKVRAGKMTPEQRAAQLAAAHQAWREPRRRVAPELEGKRPRKRYSKSLVEQPTFIDADGRRRHSPELLAAKAALREQRGDLGSPGEIALGGWLRDRGHVPTPQKAIGKYNVDLAMAPVAVEVLGGGWHLTNRKHAVRTPYILNEGWHLVFAWDHEGDSALACGAADYIVAFLNQVRRDPPSVSQYRVISGNGQLLAAGSADDNKFTLVPPPRGCESARS